MWFSLGSFALLIAVIVLAIGLPATYALYVAKRGLESYRKRRLIEARTLAWHYLALVVAFVIGGYLALITFGMINLIIVPAAIADLGITAYNRRLERRMRAAAGLCATDEAEPAPLPRAYAFEARRSARVGA